MQVLSGVLVLLQYPNDIRNTVVDIVCITATTQSLTVLSINIVAGRIVRIHHRYVRQHGDGAIART